jgi:hypothetical protein
MLYIYILFNTCPDNKSEFFLRSMVVVRCWKNQSFLYASQNNLLVLKTYSVTEPANTFKKPPMTITIFHQSNEGWALKKAIDNRRDNCDEFFLMYYKNSASHLKKPEYRESGHIQKDTIVKIIHLVRLTLLKRKKSMRIQILWKI